MSKVCNDATLTHRQTRMDREFSAKREEVEARLRRGEITFATAMQILHNLRADQYAALRRRSA